MKDHTNAQRQFLDNLIVKELYREHMSRCFMRKVSLKPVYIHLYNSDTRWGEYNPLTESIAISRNLITTHSWYNVLGVLYHEMAHQLVHEKYHTIGLTRKPHDVLFKEACKILGVPEQFSKSGLDLTQKNINWKLDSHNEVTEKMFEKVKKLLALADSTNENEAAIAMQRVQEIYEKYNLEKVLLNEKNTYYHHTIVQNITKTPSWVNRLYSILLNHFYVRVISIRSFDPHTGKHFGGCEIIGTRENVLMAEHVYYFLTHQVEYLTEQERRKRFGRFSLREKNSFRWGLMQGFDLKLEQMRESEINKSGTVFESKGLFASSTRNTNGESSSDLIKNKYALITMEQKKQLDHYINDIFMNVIKSSTRRVSIDSESFKAGESEGKNIKLHKPMEHNSERKFLS